MMEESLEFVQTQYDHIDGLAELSKLLKKEKEYKGLRNILELAQLKQPIHLKQFKRTYKYTRPGNLFFHFIETMIYLFISHISAYIYLSMILSMYANCGLISMVYPFAVFGYALLEETRPKEFFWRFIRKYTIIIIFIKLLVNINLKSLVVKKNKDETYSFSEFAGWLKLGLYSYDKIKEVTLYFMPEILILMCLTMNEIYLRMLGLYFETEDEIENIIDGLKRNIEEGDEKKIKHDVNQRFHMNMSELFISKRE